MSKRSKNSVVRAGIPVAPYAIVRSPRRYSAKGKPTSFYSVSGPGLTPGPTDDIRRGEAVGIARTLNKTYALGVHAALDRIFAAFATTIDVSLLKNVRRPNGSGSIKVKLSTPAGKVSVPAEMNVRRRHRKPGKK